MRLLGPAWCRPAPRPTGSRRRRATLLAALLVATSGASAVVPARAVAEDTPIASQATTARAASLAEDPVWQALLHRARRRPDRATRRALMDAGFFLDAEGARRPARELAATVAAMSAADAERARTTRCRFPARHRFLARHGLVPAERGACRELDAWRAEIGDVQLTLVFPEAFLGNPSSMFGHTLLRFDPVDGGPGGEALLGWTLDYTADPGEDMGPLYLLRGLAGGYRGRFGIAPYYVKIRLYGDWQDRDIWEYPLSMAPEDVERVLLHVWEMRGVGLPYFFFTRNCSEYLLEILAVGWPGIGRGGGFPPTVTPVDTLRAMAAVAPGTLGEPRLRPSPATRLQEALADLGREDAWRVEALAAGALAPDDATLATLVPERHARLLTIAHDLVAHRALARRIDTGAARARASALLRARSRLPPTPRSATSATPATVARASQQRVPPHEGHGTARVVASGGIQDREGFLELRVQPAFHTALDAPGGFAEGGEIRFLDTALRYYPALDRVRLHELVALDVTTASPWRPPFRPLAWHTEIGLRTRLVSKQRGRGLETASLFRMQGGLGAAVAPRPRLHVYGFGEVVVEASPAIEGDASVGPLVRAGLSWSTPKARYTVHLEGLTGGLLGREPSEWLRLELGQRLGITRGWSAFATGHLERAYGVGHLEGRVGLIRYF